MSDLALKALVTDWKFQARQMRRDAEILLEKAALLEVKYIDLEIAIDKAEKDAGK